MIRLDDKTKDFKKNQMIRSKRMKSIAEVLEEASVLIDNHFFNEFSDTKSSAVLKHLLENQAVIEIMLFKKTWRTLNCSPKNHESHLGTPGEPAVHWGKERIDKKRKG